MKKRIRRILSGVLCAAVLAASASPKSVFVAESDLLSVVSAESSMEANGDTSAANTDTGKTADAVDSGSEDDNPGSAGSTDAEDGSTGTAASGDSDMENTAMGSDSTENAGSYSGSTENISSGSDSAEYAGSGSDSAENAGSGSDSVENAGSGSGSTENMASANTNGSTESSGTDNNGQDSPGANNGSSDSSEGRDNASTEESAEKEGAEGETEAFTGALTGTLLALSLTAESGLNVNKSYISGLAVKSLVDGTAPFDDDDNVGNDSGESNRIVRTFDYLNYTLEYTTALIEPSETVDEAYLMVEFTLACDPSVAEFNSETLNWCVDQEITYVYADGTSSTSWNSGKTVTEQILGGKRYLSKSGDANAIPGTGTLSVGVYVKAAKNGDVIQPTFTVWMEGNEENLYRSIKADSVRVSAEPRYNISLVRNGSCDYLGYFDTGAGTISATDTDGSVYGRLEGYALTLQLYNTSADKGLKGIELPVGNITFDLTLTENLDEKDVSTETDYTPILWDYRENTYASQSTVGKLGRQMVAGGALASAYGTHCQPWNSGGASNIRACYSGGSWSIAQDNGNGNVYHVTVSGYAFDLDNLKFPNTSCDNATENTYGANIGCFSAGYVEVVVQFARSVDTTSDLYFLVDVGNLAASSLSGQSTTTDQVDSDNSNGLNVTLYALGAISKRNHYNTIDYVNRASLWSSGDFYASQGEQIMVVSVADFAGDGCLTSINLLQKIDDEAFEVPAGTTTYNTISVRNTLSDIGTVRVLFAAKPDKSGWQSDAEMNAAREEELVYFESIDALNAAEYTCVGFLYEIRNCSILRGSTDSAAVVIYMQVTVKDSASIGSVYQTTNDMRAWRTDTNVISWTDFSYGNGASGLGSSGWKEGSYAGGYTTPDYISYTNYGKTVYRDGNVVAGHSGGYIAGNSCLIIGCKTGVTIQVADTTTTTAGVTTSKAVYDLDAGERTVTYVIHPTVSVVSANREVNTSAEITDVTVWATLPKDLTYIMDSASRTPSEVKENVDGTSTVTWEIPSCIVGEAIEDITLSCLIGAAGTADDVQNNDTITISASISADKDGRLITKAFGNYSETTISVIRLASTSVSKAVERSIVEVGDELTYILRYGNSAKTDEEGVVLYDILPYNGDARGSDYSGSYVIESIVLDFTNAPETLSEGKSSFRIRTTAQDAAREKNNAEAIVKGTDSFTWDVAGGGSVSGSAITYSDLSISGAAGMVFELGTVKAQEYVKITMTLAVRDDSGALLQDASGAAQTPGDLYANSFYEYADGLVALVESNTVKIQVAERTVSGTAWLDADKDGIRENSETYMEGLTVSLYRTSVSGYASLPQEALTVNNTKLYTAYDVLGNPVEAVKTDVAGSYQFTKLEAGTYCVVFTGTEEYGLTVQNAGTDDTVDSDASATIREQEIILENAWISNIALPVLDEMYAYLAESNGNDAGFVELNAALTLTKTEKDSGALLPGAVFTLQDANGAYLTFANGSYDGKTSSISEAAYLTTGADGSIVARNLPRGSYTLAEYQAPTGYQAVTTTWSIQVSVKVTDDVWSAPLSIDGVEKNALSIADTPQITKVTVKKEWKDDDNQDGLRTEVTFTLTGTITGENGTKVTVVSEEAVLSKEAALSQDSSGHSCIFENLPAYAQGQAVIYSVEEKRMEGYVASYSAMEGDWKSGYTITVTNTHETEETSYTVKKVWEDDDNRDGIRPEEIEVTLLGSDGSERTATVKAKEGWQYSFSGLPVYWNAGTLITYTLEEELVEGYEGTAADADSTQQFAVTNTHEITLVDITVEKRWNDRNDQDGVRASAITVILTGSDGSTREAELTGDSSWKYVFEDLPKYWNEGALITYSLQEKETDGYTEEVIAGEDGYSFTVTNNHIPAVTDVVVIKNWEDADDQDGLRPESISVKLSGSDGSAYEAELTEENGYSRLFSGLPVYYSHGSTVAYSVSECAVDGYTTEIEKNSSYRFTITNTHIPETTEVTVNKIWEDEENRDGVRADFLRVTLSGSDGNSYVADLTEENGWSETFTELPLYYYHGEKVIYTVEEDPTAHYEAELAAAEDGSEFTFTNTHEIFTINLTVVKLWEDENDLDSIRPDTVEVTLTGSDGSSRTATLTAEDDWTYIFADLPQYVDGGEEILYTLSETEIEGYTSVIMETEDGFTVTNMHTPEPETEEETESGTEAETDPAKELETEPESEGEPETDSENESEISTENGKATESESETEGTKTTSADGNPKTGDPSRPIFWLTLALAGAGVMFANLSCERKRKRGQERK
ncbi:MAG: Cna B-type domain-containing protein [Lachnospiraceae bacterium]|nr:Cna B-type domain-containing protein [Lachnospiraceae bacterium]